jgi:uncharacterized protein YjiS (DUF1127 family)
MLRTLWKWLVDVYGWFLRAGTRRELRNLPDRMLKDIGLSRHDIDSMFR